MNRRHFLASAVTVAPGLVAGCSSGGGTKVVEVGPGGDFVFSPGTDAPLEISTGTTVRFVWKSGGHNVHVDSQPDGAGWEGHASVEDAGFEFEHTFGVAGEYHYWCEPHRSAGMVGDVTVESGGGGMY